MNTSNDTANKTLPILVKAYKSLLFGSKMAKLSALILVITSLNLAYQAKDHSLMACSLLFGALSLLWYTYYFLSYQELQEKSYTLKTLNETISKFKAYIAHRKKHEMWFMLSWIVSFTPYYLTLRSSINTFIMAIIYILFIGILGKLAFLRVDQQILGLENALKNNIYEF